jgi:hypothetical protein
MERRSIMAGARHKPGGARLQAIRSQRGAQCGLHRAARASGRATPERSNRKRLALRQASAYITGAILTGGPCGPAAMWRQIRDVTMTSFDNRKDAFENRFAHDEELRFKALARRNKLLGLWAAEKLGKSGADADAYAKSVVIADFEEAGDDDVVRKVKADFAAGNVDQSDHQIRRTMDELLAQAIEQIKSGT